MRRVVALLGWLNWLVLASCVLGEILGVMGEKRSAVVINVAVGVVAILRRVLGGGLL